MRSQRRRLVANTNMRCLPLRASQAMQQITGYMPAEKGKDTRPFLAAEQGLCDVAAAQAIDVSATYLPDNFWRRKEIAQVLQAVSRRGNTAFALAGSHRIATIRLGRWLLFTGGVRAELIEAKEFFYDLPFLTAGHDGWSSPSCTSVLGAAFHWRTWSTSKSYLHGTDFAQVNRRIMLSPAEFSHTGVNQRDFFTERFVSMYGLSPIPFIRAMSSDTAANAINFSKLTLLDRDKHLEEAGRETGEMYEHLVIRILINTLPLGVSIVADKESVLVTSVLKVHSHIKVGDRLTKVFYEVEDKAFEIQLDSVKTLVSFLGTIASLDSQTDGYIDADEFKLYLSRPINVVHDDDGNRGEVEDDIRKCTMHKANLMLLWIFGLAEITKDKVIVTPEEAGGAFPLGTLLCKKMRAETSMVRNSRLHRCLIDLQKNEGLAPLRVRKDGETRVASLNKCFTVRLINSEAMRRLKVTEATRLTPAQKRKFMNTDEMVMLQ